MLPTDRNHHAGARRLLLSLTVLALPVLLFLLAAQPSGAQEPILPEVPPDGEFGLLLYDARCANCHGVTGAGDGELSGNMPTPPKAFTDPAYRRTADPAVMYDQITNGNLNVGMPPFGPASTNPIDDAGRWDLVAAVYSLSTPAEAVERGREVYTAECAACHGDTGLGDGPEADAATPPTDLTRLDYWFNRSNETVFTALAPNAIPAHAYDIGDDDLWAAVDFARTFSYTYVDPAILTQPIPAGVIAGQVLNGTTGETLTGETVSLRAFTPDFTETLSLTTTLETDGTFRFDVTDVGPDWVYIASVPFGDLSFSSNADQLRHGNPELDMPITVYESTTDPAAISIGQLHVVLEFVDENRVRVNELYIFNNADDTVYVGPSGDPAQGTVEVVLPAGAENLSFQRSFGSLDSFVPANDLIQTAAGWADRLPIRPGSGALTLLTRYELPYEDGMTIAHPLNYPTDSGTIILPDAGVEVVGNEWTTQGPQTFQTGEVFLNYNHPALTAGEAIAIELEGRPRQVAGTEGATANRNQTTELIIGGTALLLVAGAGIFLFRSWQARQAPEPAYVAEVGAAVAAPVARPSGEDADALLRAIAELDDAHESGQIDEASYAQQRDALKRRLAAVWGK
jgi:mono/diheme cytochrome c family protein